MVIGSAVELFTQAGRTVQCRSSRLKSWCPAVIVPRSSRRASCSPPATPEGDRLDARRGPDRSRAPFAFPGCGAATGVRSVGGGRRRLGDGGSGARARGGDPTRRGVRRHLLRHCADLRRGGGGAAVWARAPPPTGRSRHPPPSPPPPPPPPPPPG